MDNMPTNETLYLTVDQCAARYNISKRHFLRLVKSGEMPQPIKLGKVNRWPIRLLEMFEAKQNNKHLAAFEKASRW